MSYPVTIVSALFNIRRENMDGRKWEEYLEWFDIFLKLKSPMILFVTEEVVDFIKERREGIPTEIVVQKNEEIPYYYLKERIDPIIDSKEYKQMIADPKRIECQHSMYSIIQYSKFEWLCKAVEMNPFGSDHFFWMDAGSSRFFGRRTHPSLDYPAPDAVKSLSEMGDSFLVQMNMEYYQDLANAVELPEEYLLDNRSYILGTMFGGGPKSIKKVSEYMKDVLENLMIEKGFVNNEQIAFGYLVKKYPDDFSVYERYNGVHMDLFTELG